MPLAAGLLPEAAVHVVLRGVVPMNCAYCGEQPGRTRDHLIKRAAARRRPEAAFHRRDGDLIVWACWACNVAIGTRCFVPESHADRIADLERWTGQRYAVWSREAMREVL